MTSPTKPPASMLSNILPEITLSSYGLVGTADDVATWNAAIAAINTMGGSVRLRLPEGGTTLATAPNPILSNNVTIIGGKVTFGTAAFIAWGNSSFTTSGGGMSGVRLVGPGTGVSAQLVLAAAVLMDFTNLTISGITTLARLGTSSGTTGLTSVNTIRFRNIYGTVANVGAAVFDCIYGSGFWLSDFNIQVEGIIPAAFNRVSTWPANASRNLVNFTFSLWDTGDISDGFTFGFNKAMYIVANLSVVIQNITIRNSWLDGLGGGILCTALSGGVISCVTIKDNPFLTSWDSHGVLFNGAGAHIGHKVDGNRICSVAGHGVWFDATCSGFTANDNHIYGYSRLADNSFAIFVDTACLDFTLVGNNVNMPSAASLGYSWTTTIPYGIRNLASATTRYSVAGNIGHGTLG